METPRKFYRTVYTVEVLSEDKIEPDADLQAVAFEAVGGAYSWRYSQTANEEVSGPEMAKLLVSQGSDAGFFELTDEGEDLQEI